MMGDLKFIFKEFEEALTLKGKGNYEGEGLCLRCF